MSDPVDWALLTRYVAGSCTPAERSAVDQWMAASTERRALMDSVRSITAVADALPPAPGTFDAHAGADRIWERLRPATPRRAAWGAMHRTQSRRQIAAFAGTLVVAVGMAVVIGRVSAPRSAAQAVRELVSAPGGRTSLTLRDGTRLVLGPASRLRIPGDFGHRTRTVELDGEALFTVAHDAAHPFAVRTARATVRDVGTVFDVRAYADDDDEHITVAEGEVQLGSVGLHARDMALVNPSGQIQVRSEINVAPELAWTQGGLAFRDTPLSEVARQVGRVFNLRVTIADSTLAGRLITATFGPESADDVLTDLTHILGARYQRTGQLVVIKQQVGRAGHEGPMTTPDALQTARAQGPGR